MKKRRLTQAEFDTIRPLIRMTPERVESARLVLVDGMTYEGAGRLRPGPKPYTRQAVGDAVGIVLRVHESYLATQEAAGHAGKVLPPGWEVVTLVAPSALIAEFRSRVAGLEAPAKSPRVRTRRTTRAEAR